MILNDILDKINSIEVNNAYLYFITRVLKPQIKKTTKALDKYDYKVYQIDIDSDIRTHLFDVTRKQLVFLKANKNELEEYDVIADNSEQLLTYKMNDKQMSFAEVINTQLKSVPPKIQSLEEIILEEELWAYSVGFLSDVNDWVYTFRKILASKVAIDENSGNKKNAMQKAMRTMFNSKSQKLELIQGETVNLDKQVDCFFYVDTFYIAKKTQFEQIVGLEEEFKIQAGDIVAELKGTNMIDGVEIITQQIDINPSIHKKLVRLSKIGNHKTLDTPTITKMEAVCKSFGDTLKLKNGRLLIEDEKDIDLVLKMLSDYYKRGEVSGKAYGTFAGKQILQSE